MSCSCSRCNVVIIATYGTEGEDPMKGYFAAWGEGEQPGPEERGPHGHGGRGGGPRREGSREGGRDAGRSADGPGGYGPGRGFGPRGRGRGGAPEAPDAVRCGRLVHRSAARRSGSPARRTVSVDRDEIIVVGELPALTDEFADDAARAAAEAGRISPVPGGHPRAAHRDRPSGTASLRSGDFLGSATRRIPRSCSPRCRRR